MRTQIVTPSVKNSSVCVLYSTQMKGVRNVTRHLHDEYEITLCMEGKMDFYINDTICNLSKGDIVFINKKIPHSSFAHKGSHTAVLIFGKNQMTDNDNDSLYEMIHPHNEEAFLFKKGTLANDELSQCISAVLKENLEKKPSYEMYIKAEIIKIFAILYRNNILTNPDNFRIPSKAERLLPVVEYINNNFDKELNLDNISSIVNISKSHFCKIFKRTFNISFVDYITGARIHNAEKLLLLSDKPIGDIAEECGFSSAEYFSKTFKKIEKCTPMEYRKLKET